jgi:hypothetical protein
MPHINSAGTIVRRVEFFRLPIWQYHVLFNARARRRKIILLPIIKARLSETAKCSILFLNHNVTCRIGITKKQECAQKDSNDCDFTMSRHEHVAHSDAVMKRSFR